MLINIKRKKVMMITMITIMMMMMTTTMMTMMMMMIKNIRIDRTISGWAASVDLAKRPTPELQLSVDELHNNFAFY